MPSTGSCRATAAWERCCSIPTSTTPKLRARLFAVVSESELREDYTDLAHWTRGDRKARFEEMAERHGALSRFAAPFLARMDFLDEDGSSTSPTLEALRAYREIRAAGRRTLSPVTPIDFIPRALEPLVCRDGAIDRRRWESALFLKVCDEIRAGNLAINGAKNFGRFTSFFLPAAEWRRTRDDFWARTGFPVEPDRAVIELTARLSDAFDRFLDAVPDNHQVTFDDDGWRLKTDRAEPPDTKRSASLAALRRWIDERPPLHPPGRSSRSRWRTTWGSARTSCDRERSSPRPTRSAYSSPRSLAHGCNLGLHTMEKIAPGIPYARLKHVSDWRLLEENQRAALAGLVHGISRLDAAGRWGEGRTSASDGQRFAIARHARIQPRTKRLIVEVVRQRPGHPAAEARSRMCETVPVLTPTAAAVCAASGPARGGAEEFP